MQGEFVRYDGKFVPQGHFLRAQQMMCKAVRRALCGVAFTDKCPFFGCSLIMAAFFVKEGKICII